MIIGINGRIGHGKDTVGQIIQWLSEYPEGINRTDGKNRSFNSFVMDVGMGYEPKWEIKKYAYKLKQIASILTGIPMEKFENQEFKKTYLSNQWNRPPLYFDENLKLTTEKGKGSLVSEEKMTVREFLQRLGTDAIRVGLHSETWVNALFVNYTPYSVRGSSYEEVESKWLITDTRFPNEAQAIKDRGGLVIRVNRNLPQQDYTTLEQHTARLHPSETALDNWPFDHVIENNSTMDALRAQVKDMLVEFGLLNLQKVV